MERSDPWSSQAGNNEEYQPLFGEKGLVEEKTVITPLYSHSDGRGQPLLVSMVCASKEHL